MTDKKSFLSFIKSISTPLIALTYIGTFFIQLKNYADTLGWRFLFISILLLSIAWSIYVFLAKKETIIEPKKKFPKYNSIIRYSSFVFIVVSIIPVIYSYNLSPEFPQMPVRFENATTKTAIISKWGEFYLSVPDSPFSEFQIGSGRLSLDSEKNYLNIPPDSTKTVYVSFINGKRYMPALTDGDKNLRVVFYRDSSRIVQQTGIIFNMDNIKNHYCLIRLTEY